MKMSTTIDAFVTAMASATAVFSSPKSLEATNTVRSVKKTNAAHTAT